jgi:hypothetical protein
LFYLVERVTLRRVAVSEEELRRKGMGGGDWYMVR